MKKRIGLILVLGAIVLVGVHLFSPKRVVAVMMYHHVNASCVERDKINTVSPASFARQMEFLSRNNFHVLGIDEYVEALVSGRPLPLRSVVITFDDGDKDNFTEAYPVLRRYGFPAAMFVPSNTIGVVAPDPRDSKMTWPDLREMAAHKITIGSHLMDEEYLPDLPPERQREEIFGSKVALEKGLGHPVLYIAYPTGGFSAGIEAMAREAGYRAAFTTNRGKDRFNRDLFAIRRVHIKDSDNDLVLWGKLTGYYNFFRKCKNSN